MLFRSEVGRIGYDKKAAATCLAYVRGRTCEHPQLHADSDEEIAGKAACAAVFKGRMGRNGPCLAASECAGLAVCGFDPTCTDSCCVGACRVLAPPPAVGEACSGNCEAGSYCDFDPNTGNFTTCKQAPGLGKPCPRGTCSGDAVCDYTGDSPLCVPPKPVGQRCYGDDECAQPGVCRYDPQVGDSTCFKPSDEGGPCRYESGGQQCLRFDNACTPGNVCAPLPGKGESCQGIQCAGDFFCSESQGYLCTPVADEGEGVGGDVHGIDVKSRGGHAGIQQSHGKRVRFFARGTGHAEDAERAFGMTGQPFAGGELGEGVEGFAIAEEPRLGDDHGFDEFVELPAGIPQELVVIGFAFQAVLLHPQPDGAFDQRGADRSGVEADLFA